MYSLNARDHFNCSPLQHHEIDAAKWKGGNQNTPVLAKKFLQYSGVGLQFTAASQNYVE